MILNFLKELNKNKKNNLENLETSNLLDNLDLRLECTYNFSKIDKNDRLYVITIIRTVHQLLEYYKIMPYIYPDWLNMSVNINSVTIDKNIIYQNIGYYMITHTIDEQYREIPYFKKSIDKLFYRAIWHLASSIDKFTKKSVNKLVRLFDGFCLLSRKKTKKEFEITYKENYKYITNISEDVKIKVPFEIYDKYCDKDYADIFDMIYDSYRYTTIADYINSYIFFYNLVDTFVPVDI